MLEWIRVSCPYCGHMFETSVDCSAGDQHYIEDCRICCSPISVAVSVNGEGEPLAVTTKREDE